MTLDRPSVALPTPSPSLRGARLLGAATLALLLAACGGGDDPGPQDLAAACRLQVNDTPERLLGCVTPEGVRAHLSAFADIAQANGGSRVTGSPGYDASVQYVADKLREAGYGVRVEPFEFRAFEPLAPSVLEQRAPSVAPIESEYLTYSGSGETTAAVAVPAQPTGCTAADFAGFPVGAIALIRRGDCAFSDKAQHAFNAGASGVVIYNHEEGPVAGTLFPEFAPELPVLGITREAGEQLLAALPQGLVLHLRSRTLRQQMQGRNVLAESAGGDPAHVAMLGAHLDSVAGTAGINDNGSGTAALLETAIQLARVQPANRLRFAFWGAEEMGVVGSERYVTGLSAAERDRIALYLNFDMIASPNYVFEVYSGDGSPPEGEAPRAPAAAVIEQVFADFYGQRGLPWKRGSDEGRSDHAPFGEHGIPFGGLHTGAEVRKTEEEARLWGGEAGQPYDACYHQACDGLGNLDAFALDTNADAVAWAVLHFAMQRVPR